MTYIVSTNQRTVRVVTDGGSQIVLTGDPASSELLINFGGQGARSIKREELLDGLIEMYGESIAYSFKSEDDD